MFNVVHIFIICYLAGMMKHIISRVTVLIFCVVALVAQSLVVASPQCEMDSHHNVMASSAQSTAHHFSGEIVDSVHNFHSNDSGQHCPDECSCLVTVCHQISVIVPVLFLASAHTPDGKIQMTDQPSFEVMSKPYLRPPKLS